MEIQGVLLQNGPTQGGSLFGVEGDYGIRKSKILSHDGGDALITSCAGVHPVGRVGVLEFMESLKEIYQVVTSFLGDRCDNIAIGFQDGVAVVEIACGRRTGRPSRGKFSTEPLFQGDRGDQDETPGWCSGFSEQPGETRVEPREALSPVEGLVPAVGDKNDGGIKLLEVGDHFTEPFLWIAENRSTSTSGSGVPEHSIAIPAEIAEYDPSLRPTQGEGGLEVSMVPGPFKEGVAKKRDPVSVPQFKGHLLFATECA